MTSQPSTSAHHQRPERGEGLLFVVVLGAMGGAMVMWAGGELSGLITSGRRPGATLAQMGGTLAHLVGEPGDPASAWPRGTRGALPGPVVFYTVLLVLTGAAAVLFVVTRRGLIRLFSDPGAHSGSKWAKPGDLRNLIVKNSLPGRLVLGRVGTRLVAAEERQSVIVLGPTQSLKTSGFAIPSILEWEGPVLATSVKTDLVRDTIAARSRRGNVWIYDPTTSTQFSASQWSPLHFCRDWGGAQRTATWLAGATRTNGSGLSDSEFWYAASAKLLAPLLFAAATSERSMADVVRWINTQDEREVKAALEAAGSLRRWMLLRRRGSGRGGRRVPCTQPPRPVLSAYEDPVVAQSAARCDITPGRLLDGGAHTLYVVSPSHEQRRLRPLFETLIQTILNFSFELASWRGHPLDLSLLVVLDEAANIAPLRDLDSLASTAASHGIQLLSVFQDLAQVSTRYGERAQTVINNHRAKILLSGISDTQTLEYASRLLGDEEVLQSSVTRGSYGSRSTTESTALRSIAPANVLRSIRPGEGVLVYGHLPPARLRLRPWFKEKQFTAPAAQVWVR